MSTSKQQHVLPTTNEILEAGKDKINAAYFAAQDVAQKIEEKIEEKTGYKLSSAEPRKSEFVQYYDPLARPEDLQETKAHLKHAETIDKSKPVIDQNVHIKENHHKDLLTDLAHRHPLHHVMKTETHDASAPVIDQEIHIKEAPQKQVMADITKHHDLKHVEMKDKSAPMIPKDIHIVKKKKLIE